MPEILWEYSVPWKSSSGAGGQHNLMGAWIVGFEPWIVGFEPVLYSWLAQDVLGARWVTAELCGVSLPSLQFRWRFGFKEIVQQRELLRSPEQDPGSVQ